ncbi:replication licensing factor Cdt1 [Mactra antiquata]
MSRGKVTDFFSTRKRNPASQPSKRRKVEITSTPVDISTLDRTNTNQYRNLTQENEDRTETPIKGDNVFSPLQTRAARKAKQSAPSVKKVTRSRKVKPDPKQLSIEASLSTVSKNEKATVQVTESVTSSWDEHDGPVENKQETPQKSTEETIKSRKRCRNGKTTVKDDQKSDEATPEKRTPPVLSKQADTEARKKLQLVQDSSSENSEESGKESNVEKSMPRNVDNNTKASKIKISKNIESAMEKVKAMETKSKKAKTTNAEDLKTKLSNVSNLEDLKSRLAEMKETRKKIDVPKLEKFDNIKVEVKTNSEEKPELKPKVPAYERFHHLATPSAPTLNLPYKYKLLADQFRGMDQVVSMLHNRNETCTFSKLKHAVQELTKRNFERDHVGKIKTVCPDAYEFRQEKGLQNVQGFKESGYQLTVEARFKAEEYEKCSRPTFKASHLLSRRTMFHNGLIHTVKQYHKEFLSKLSRPLSIPEDKITRWHPKFPLDEVPDIVTSFLPQPPDVKIYQTAKDVLASTTGKVTPKIEEALISTIKKEEAETVQPKPSVTAVSTLSKPLSGNMKGVPLSLLEKIRAKEAAKTATALTRDPKTEKRLSMMKRLPDIMRIIRSHFVTEKKPALPIDSVIQKVIDSHKSGIAPGDVEPHINLCIELIPEWISSVHIKKGRYLKIDRTVELQQLTDKVNNLIKKQ